jgi:hypothetical protein
MVTKTGSTFRRAAPVLFCTLLQGAFAQTTSTVTVQGTRAPAGTAGNVNAAKSKVMTHHRASSCNFMGSPGAAEDDVALAYMSDFGMEDSSSNDAEHFTDVAPGGDASNAATSSSLAGLDDTAADTGTPSAGCGPADRRFAAGRNHIERKDRSLALAFEAFDNKDYARAADLFTTAWNKIGYEEAALALAKMNLYGLGMPRNPARAISWLQEVTEARYDPGRDRQQFDPQYPLVMSPRSEAAFMLARIHERGIGVAKDPAQAKRWYERSADFGFVPALDILGQGWLSERKPVKAQTSFKEAADAGYVPAQYDLGKLYYNGDDGVPRNLQLAAAYFGAAARAGHPGALFAAGRMLDLGQGIPADQKKAAIYYKQAAVKGNRDARYALATYFYEGGVVPKNLDTARQLFEAAARQGQPDAMFNLGAMEVNGEGGPRDAVGAYVWLSLASASGNANAAGALKSVAPLLTALDLAKANAILKPATK